MAPASVLNQPVVCCGEYDNEDKCVKLRYGVVWCVVVVQRNNRSGHDGEVELVKT